MAIEDARQESYTSYEAWKGWDQLFEYTPDKADYFRGETRDLAIHDADVLEMGFGSGDLLQWLIDQGARVNGSEINPVLVRAAIDRGIPVVEAEIERIARLHPGRYGTIIALDVFEHFTFAEVALRLEAAEILLKPGGKLLLRFPNAQSPFGLHPQCGDPTHLSGLSKSVFESLLIQRCLTIERYSAPYRAKGRGVRTVISRWLRYALRDLITKALNFTYATDIPYDPVVVIVLRKS